MSIIIFLPKTGLKPKTSGIWSDRSANWAKTTAFVITLYKTSERVRLLIAFTRCVYSLRLLVAFEKKLNKRFFSDFGFLPDSPRLEISILYWLDLSCWIDCDQCDQIL